MATLARAPTTELRVVLELSTQADGTARGEVDGVPVSTGGGRRVRLALAGGWPGAIVSVPEPPPTEPASRVLLNRSRHPGWMGAALGRVLQDAGVRAPVEALQGDGVRVEVHDDALLVEWAQEPDGPSARRAVRALARLARALPSAMAGAVGAGVQADLGARSQASSAGQRRLSDVERLERQYGRFAWKCNLLYATILVGPLTSLFAMIALKAWTRLPEPPLLYGGLLLAGGSVVGAFVAIRRLRFTQPCPRCHAPRSIPMTQVRGNSTCSSCGLATRRLTPWLPRPLAPGEWHPID